MICHICGLESRPNVLMSSHRRSKHSEVDKEEFKIELYSYSGREPKTCDVCGEETRIPRGEAEYPSYHRECFDSKLKDTTRSESNVNWRGGKIHYSCDFCSTGAEKHRSLLGDTNFCSVSCSTRYHYCVKNDIPFDEYEPVSERPPDRTKDVTMYQLRKSCFDSYNYTCDLCGSTGCILNAHHMNSWKYFPDQRYDLENLVCLCVSCHNEFHREYGIGRDKPNTVEQYREFKRARSKRPGS